MGRPATAAGDRQRPDSDRTAVDRELARVVESGLARAPAAIADPVRYAVLAPGKRVRPLLVIASYRAAGGGARTGRATGIDTPPVSDAVLRLACAVELVHAYSLMHDDLPCMDDDELRRGRATVHVRFGVREAILAGAALMPMAVRTLDEAGRALALDEDTIARLVRILTAASGAGGMVGGQLLDLRAEGRRVGDAELEGIHLGKTARLIEASCVLGGTAAGSDAAGLARLGRFGRWLGLAFQVVDDILDVTGTAQSMGKTGGRDEALGKATYAGLLGLEGARARARDLVGRALAEIAPMAGADDLARIARWVVERDR